MATGVADNGVDHDLSADGAVERLVDVLERRDDPRICGDLKSV